MADCNAERREEHAKYLLHSIGWAQTEAGDMAIRIRGDANRISNLCSVVGITEFSEDFRAYHVALNDAVGAYAKEAHRLLAERAKQVRAEDDGE